MAIWKADGTLTSDYLLELDPSSVGVVVVDPPSVGVIVVDPSSAVGGLGNRTGCISDEFSPSQSKRFTAATCIRISSRHSRTMRLASAEDSILAMFRDGT